MLLIRGRVTPCPARPLQIVGKKIRYRIFYRIFPTIFAKSMQVPILSRNIGPIPCVCTTRIAAMCAVIQTYIYGLTSVYCSQNRMHFKFWNIRCSLNSFSRVHTLTQMSVQTQCTTCTLQHSMYIFRMSIILMHTLVL